ncbi:Hypothetical predicted protein [Paramuricea clavata]|uniref:Uncharacterized protein n=1 Tax=Paramuricea clavata TaxID=317549 RepID=A0A7D9I4X7_PARCT|nr:Hypothetical predicted protein [Paramuricea clavata]
MQKRTAPMQIAAKENGNRQARILHRFRRTLNRRRQTHFKPNKKKSRVGETQAKDEVIINVGLMEYEYGEAKIQHDKSFPVKLSKDMGYDEVRERALKKWEDYDRTFSRDHGYVVTFEDGKLGKQIPGSSEEFTLRKYKEGLGKSYSRIVLYLCPATEKRTESTMPITNWLSEKEAEIERVLWDSDRNVDDFTDDFIDSSTEASATPVPAPSPHQPETLDENSAVQQEIDERFQQLGNTEEEVKNENPNDLEDESVVMLIKDHANKMITGDPRSVVVSRLSIWETTKPYFLRQRFLQRNGLLRVTFATFEGQEDSVDNGGPRWEFFH